MTTKIPSLVGQSLRSAGCDHNTAEWIFHFEDYVLQVSALWRLISGGLIWVGHDDDGHQFGLGEPVIAADRVCASAGSRVVADAWANDTTADLSIDFGDGIRLEVFNNSCGYEGWILNARDGHGALVAEGGGKLSTSLPTELGIDPE
jgi:hypothetical protein